MQLNQKIGAALILFGTVQFLMLLHIAEALYSGYSTSQNAISDLGATCHSSVCTIVQPSSTIFNSSVFLLGLLLVLGSYCLYRGALQSSILYFSWLGWNRRDRRWVISRDHRKLAHAHVFDNIPVRRNVGNLLVPISSIHLAPLFRRHGCDNTRSACSLRVWCLPGTRSWRYGENHCLSSIVLGTSIRRLFASTKSAKKSSRYDLMFKRVFTTRFERG